MSAHKSHIVNVVDYPFRVQCEACTWTRYYKTKQMAKKAADAHFRTYTSHRYGGFKD